MKFHITLFLYLLIIIGVSKLLVTNFTCVNPTSCESPLLIKMYFYKNNESQKEHIETLVNFIAKKHIPQKDKDEVLNFIYNYDHNIFKELMKDDMDKEELKKLTQIYIDYEYSEVEFHLPLAQSLTNYFINHPDKHPMPRIVVLNSLSENFVYPNFNYSSIQSSEQLESISFLPKERIKNIIQNLKTKITFSIGPLLSSAIAYAYQDDLPELYNVMASNVSFDSLDAQIAFINPLMNKPGFDKLLSSLDILRPQKGFPENCLSFNRLDLLQQFKNLFDLGYSFSACNPKYPHPLQNFIMTKTSSTQELFEKDSFLASVIRYHYQKYNTINSKNNLLGMTIREGLNLSVAELLKEENITDDKDLMLWAISHKKIPIIKNIINNYRASKKELLLMSQHIHPQDISFINKVKKL